MVHTDCKCELHTYIIRLRVSSLEGTLRGTVLGKFKTNPQFKYGEPIRAYVGKLEGCMTAARMATCKASQIISTGRSSSSRSSSTSTGSVIPKRSPATRIGVIAPTKAVSYTLKMFVCTRSGADAA